MAWLAVGKAIELCTKCFNLYDRFSAPGDALTSLNKRVQHLRVILVALQGALSDNEENLDTNPDLTKHLEDLLSQAQTDLSTVQQIFTERDPARHDVLDQLYYVFSSDSKKIDQTKKHLDKLSSDIAETQQALQTVILIKLGRSLNIEGDASRLRFPPTYKPKHRARSRAGQTGINVIFVDPYNTSWSVVAATYLGLLSLASEQTPGAYWPIGRCDSVGYLVGANSNIPVLPDEYRSQLIWTAQTPNNAELMTLFNDPYTEKPPGTQQLEAQVVQRYSRGLFGDMFEAADYIFTFNEEHARLLNNVRNLWGSQDSKAKISCLGKYWPSKTSGNDIEFMSAQEIADPNWARNAMTKRVSRIKVCIKLWLNRDFGWIEPQGAAVNAPLGAGQQDQRRVSTQVPSNLGWYDQQSASAETQQTGYGKGDWVDAEARLV